MLAGLVGIGFGVAIAQIRGENGAVISEIPQNFPGETVRERGEKHGREKLQQPAEQGEQSAGQAAALSSTREMRGLGVQATPGAQDRVAPDSSSPFKYGTSPGQASNVPGVPFVSPNGTSNFYGTGGRPIYLDDGAFKE